jgi:hypothetical protein
MGSRQSRVALMKAFCKKMIFCGLDPHPRGNFANQQTHTQFLFKEGINFGDQRQPAERRKSAL